jgi:hypothetical protein
VRGRDSGFGIQDSGKRRMAVEPVTRELVEAFDVTKLPES